jgi:hypothetical protein
MDRSPADLPGRTTRARRRGSEDTRWLLIMIVGFAASLLVLALAYWLYRLTGPHPGVMLVLRRLRYYARWLLPGI